MDKIYDIRGDNTVSTKLFQYKKKAGVRRRYKKEKKNSFGYKSQFQKRGFYNRGVDVGILRNLDKISEKKTHRL